MPFTKDKMAFLASTPLFQGLSSQQIEPIGARFFARQVAAHSYVMMQDHQSPSVALIWNGSAKVSLEQNGRSTLLSILGEGELLGEIHLLDGQGHSADIFTLEETQLLWIDGAELSRFAQQHAQIGLNLGRILSRRLRLATDRIEALCTLDVSGRVAHILLALAREYGQPAESGTKIPLLLTQSDLGALCGATRTRVNQALASFKKLGLLETGNDNYLIVKDAEKLAKRLAG